MAVLTRAERARLWLIDVPADKVFWCCDGRVLKNMYELADALREMSDETFQYHGSRDRNDFSKWVGDVIGDVTLAKDLRRAATRATAARKVDTRLGWLTAGL